MTAVHMKEMPLAPELVCLETGAVVGRNAAEGARPTLCVRTASGDFDARPAASCLLAPEEGDQVLLAVPPSGELFVLAVLERADSTTARLEVDAESLQITLPRGRLDIMARQGIRLVTERGLAMVAREFGVEASEGRLTIANLKTIGQDLSLHAQRMAQHLRTSERHVEGIDTTRAGTIDTSAKESLSMRAKDAIVSAARIFKADGQQVHIG